jgi:hypothetical protein
VSRSPAADERSAGVLSVAFWVLAAAAYSVLRKGYQFDGYYSDDAVQAPLILNRLQPELLANDPLIHLISGRYQSGLIDLIAWLDPFVSIQVAYFAGFCIARVLTFAAIHRLVVTLTGSALAAGLGVFLVAGAAISYFGGIHFVETILTPRGFALPFALFGLEAFFRRRIPAMTAWLLVCLYIHPVTGLNFIAVIAFCGLAFPASVPRKAFLAALALLALGMVAIGVWTGQFAALGTGSGGLQYDAAWADIIEQTVGPWVYLHLLPHEFWLTSLWIPAFGALALRWVGEPKLVLRFAHVAIASAVALVLHALAVDVLNLQLLLKMSLQRATGVLCVVALAAVSLWLAASLRSADPLRRVLALAFFAAAVALRDPSIAILFGALLASAWALREAAWSARVRSLLAVVVVAGVLAATSGVVAGSFHLAPERVRTHLERLGRLGSDADWVAVQHYVRDRSEVGDVVMPPMALSPRLVAQRPSTLTWKMQSFTHLSRPFAFEFWEWRQAVGLPFERATAQEVIALARRSGASWLVLDDREKAPAPGDLRPEHLVGPFRAYKIVPGAR